MHGLLADLVLVLQAMFVAFVVFSLFFVIAGWVRGWQWVRNPWSRYAHVAAILFVVAGTWLGLDCPLTTLESRLRRLAGEAGYAKSFIADWLQWLIFFEAEPWVFTTCYTAFALLVIGAWILVPPRSRS